MFCGVLLNVSNNNFPLQIFFVLRKKDNQVSLLHLYHHSLTPIETWICVKFLAGRQISRPHVSRSPCKLLPMCNYHLVLDCKSSRLIFRERPQINVSYQLHNIMCLIETFYHLRWSWYVLKSNQQYGSRHHVFLLHDVRYGTWIPKILVVEEISHDDSIGELCNKKKRA